MLLKPAIFPNTERKEEELWRQITAVLFISLYLSIQIKDMLCFLCLCMCCRTINVTAPLLPYSCVLNGNVCLNIQIHNNQHVKHTLNSDAQWVITALFQYTSKKQIGYVTRAVYSRISHRIQPTPPVTNRTVYKTVEHLGNPGESY